MITTKENESTAQQYGIKKYVPYALGMDAYIITEVCATKQYNNLKNQITISYSSVAYSVDNS